MTQRERRNRAVIHRGLELRQPGGAAEKLLEPATSLAARPTLCFSGYVMLAILFDHLLEADEQNTTARCSGVLAA